MTDTFRIPKMKINKFKDILKMPEIDRFKIDLADGRSINMSVHIDDSQISYFLFHSTFEVYGYTNSVNDAFMAKGNACIYTSDELYELMRGRKI